jgi:hypothetical protein
MNIEGYGRVVRGTLLGNLAALAKGGRREDLVIPMGWSEPGIGKTDCMRAIVASLGNSGWELFEDQGATADSRWCYVDLDLQTRDAADLGGSPWVKNDRTVRLRPDWMPDKPMVVVALDELAQADNACLNISGTLMREGRIGEHSLPMGCLMVAASNPAGTRTGTNALPGQVRSRVKHLYIDPDPQCWARWAQARGIHPILVAYARARPSEYHHKYDRTADAYPCARGWTMVNAELQFDLSAGDLEESIAGCVGTTAAADFMGFMEAAKRMPDPDQILRDPTGAPLPEGLDLTFVTMQALSRRADISNMEPLVRYLERLPEPEFAQLCLADAVAREPGLGIHGAYARWQASNANDARAALAA